MKPKITWGTNVINNTGKKKDHVEHVPRNTKRGGHLCRRRKLDGFCWCTAIFKSYHRFSIGLRSGLWLDNFKTFKCFPLNHLSVAVSVCLGSLSCQKVNLRPRLKSLEDWNRFPSRIFLYLALSIIPSILTSFLVPVDENHPHSIMLPLTCFTVGMVFSGWCEVLGLHQT